MIVRHLDLSGKILGFQTDNLQSLCCVALQLAPGSMTLVILIIKNQVTSIVVDVGDSFQGLVFGFRGLIRVAGDSQLLQAAQRV